MDWKRIEQEIYDAASVTFAELVDELGHETFYAFCLYTDSDGGSVVPSANTEEAYKAVLDKAGDCTDLDRSYYRWYPEEWKYCAFGGDRFDAVSRKLFASTDLEHTAAAMTRALDGLRRDEAYKRLAEPPILFIGVSDDDRSEALMKESAQALNSPERASLLLQG